MSIHLSNIPKKNRINKLENNNTRDNNVRNNNANTI